MIQRSAAWCLLLVAAAGCGGAVEVELPPGAPVGSASVLLGGEVPGLPKAEALRIAVTRFNAISQLAGYSPQLQFNTQAAHSWAYTPENYYYVQAYTQAETCAGEVLPDGSTRHEFCYLTIGL